ncbi:putative inner membrane protein [Marinobacterium sp. xm-a-121]|uniref:YeeE/YedE family protein n=1 Tax=unclassified Marinobacterium TaxID=2644139 RepID=UPI0015682056|nr:MULTISPECIES: YeeE/YedE family protein [unclassified Marinobacterium]NRP37994.1 putative inner membrane protein [Marinobacterium sp. xm-a-121]NRP99246.1 putative inner membrane protein [Marinobacterium sp. xm-v-233]
MNTLNTTSTDFKTQLLEPNKLFWLMLSSALLIASAVYVFNEHGTFELLALILGAALGVCLLQASFGFTTAWRELISKRRGAGIRAQMIMLSLSVLLFFPTLASGELFGQSVTGFVRPLGLSVVAGAFMFGVGMQIASGCASGNLYHLGGGQLRAIPVMAGFSAGALWATADYEWWTTLPQLAPIGLIELLGPITAIGLNLLLFTAIYQFTKRLEIKAHGSLEECQSTGTTSFLSKLIAGPWPLIWGAVGLTILNFATLALMGRPWAVALAYPVWGAKVAQWLELDLEIDFWTYWMAPGREEALYNSLSQDPASLMNGGVILGAFLAAAIAGKFTLKMKMPIQNFLASLLGGVLLGYGATIAYGCNIGAFVGGVVSGSLHGWLWILFAFAGSVIGLKLRPLLRLK